jgi:tetratricopeptide (TPR) repeat protein
MPEPSEPEAAMLAAALHFTLRRDLAAYQIDKLGQAPFNELRSTVRRLAAEQPQPVTAALLRLAQAALEADPQRGQTLAQLALVAAAKVPILDPSRPGLFAEAYALLGDGCRRLGRLRDAERAFNRAANHLGVPGEPAPSALYLNLLADLREDQRRQEEALALRDRAAVLFRSLGQVDDLAETLLAKAALEFSRCEAGEAAIDLRTVIALADYGLRPALAGVAVLGYGSALGAARRTSEALAILRAFHDRFPDFAEASILAELHLLEGSLLVLSNRPDLAEARLKAARQEFYHSGEIGSAAAACLSLSHVYLRLGGREHDLRQLVAEDLGPLARSCRLPERIRTVLSEFCLALESGTATAELAGVIHRFVETHREPASRSAGESKGGESLET